MHGGSFGILDPLRNGETGGILQKAAIRLHKMGEEVNTMLSFALSVAANVVAHCICKWLDEQFKAGKH